jgi:outer membrane receptor for ferrienterochelin and colicins
MLLAIPLNSFAEIDEQNRKIRTDANITGHVESSLTKEHIPWVTISVKGTALGTATDATGHYALRNLPVGTYTVIASAVGYNSSEAEVVLEKGKTQEVNFLLEEAVLGMDQVVVTSTRNETSKKGSSTIVNVSASPLFNTVGSLTLSDAMNFQPGLRVEMTCGNCGVPQLRINGLEGQYSQILLDGQPIFSSLAGVYGLEQMPVAMVERVEVIRGGGSALFGANAIGGVMNIITRDPLRNTLSLSNTTSVYHRGKTDIATSLSGAFVSDDHRAGAYLFGMVRDRSAYDRNGDGFSDIPELRGETVGVRGYFRTSTTSRLTYEYHRMHEYRRGGDQLDKPPHEALVAEQLEHEINGGEARYDFWTADYRHRLSLYSSAQGIARKSYFGTGQDPDAYGRTGDFVFNSGAQYTLSMDNLLFMPAELTTGVEYTYNNLEDNYFHRQHEVSQKINLFGGYIQNEWKNDRWGILLGARVDKHSEMDNMVFSPRTNVRYTPTEAVSLRLSYSSGYRAPQTYDEDLHVTAVSEKVSLIHNAPGLRPEYSHSVSGSVDLYHDFGRLQTNLLIEGFYTNINDAFDLVVLNADDPAADYFDIERQNSAGVTVGGMNFEMRLGIPRVFDFQAGFTAQKSRYKKPFDWAAGAGESAPQQRMFRSPDLYGYFTANVNLAKQMVGSLFGTYTGPMLVQHTIAKSDGGEILRNETSPNFFDAGVKLAYTFALTGGMNLEVNGGVKNIFDNFQPDLDRGETKDAGYIYGPAMPRMYFVGIKLTL